MNKAKILAQILSNFAVLKTIPCEEPYFNLICGKILKDFFTCGKSGIEFELAEQSLIDQHIAENIKNIESFLFGLGYTFDPNKAPELLQFRSGVQFILDHFKTFPTTERELGVLLEDLQKSESLATFDEALSTWKNSTSTDFETINHSWKSIKRPEGIPVSHFWWF